MYSDFNLQVFILTMVVLVVALTIHEFAHAITADKLGDPTPRSQGRISLWPTDHLDPIGTIMILISSLTGFGIGWGKPVMCNHGNFRNPRRDGAIVAAAGPISNILQACVFAAVAQVMIRTGTLSEPVWNLLLMGIVINLTLTFFNLIPIGPLDGHWIMIAVLPHTQAAAYRFWNQSTGMIVFLLLVFVGSQMGLLQAIIGPPVGFVASLLLTGIRIVL
jgi:Zn-dependent protease